MEKEKKRKTKVKEAAGKKEVDKKVLKIAFYILAIFCIAVFSFAVTPKTFQNDTFYTIKVGQDIRKYGIDGIDHYSWHNLPYTYPHWLYDVITSLVFDYLGGYTAIYIMTAILSIILGISLFVTNKKITKGNLFVSFAITLGQMYLMADYITARAQLVTFILFVLTILFIENFLESGKKRYAVRTDNHPYTNCKHTLGSISILLCVVLAIHWRIFNKNYNRCSFSVQNT